MTDRSRQRLTLEVLLLTGAFIASLFFNGKDIVFFALSLGAIALWAMLIHHDFYRRAHPLPLNLFTVCLFGFWLWLGIHSLFATVSYVSMVNFWWVGSLFVVAVLYFVSRHHDSLWRFAIDSIILVCAVLALVAIYQYFVLGRPPSGTFFNKNSLAALMNLLLFVLFGRFCQSREGRPKEDHPALLLVLIFLFSFGVGLIASRGAFLALVVGALVFFLVLYRRTNWVQRGWLLGTCATALLCANLFSDFGLAGKINTLSDLEAAGLSRWNIWRPSWQMFLDAPWYGIGLGSYWLAWPPYRLPEDISGGFYVHNDYLQLAIETGVPGIVLMLGMLGGALFWFVRIWRSSSLSTQRRIELVAVFCGLLSVAAHSFVSFNLYILPIDLALGLFIGRFAWLGQPTGTTRIMVLQIDKWLRPAVFRFLYFAVLAVTLLFFGLLATDSYLFHKASRLAKQGKLQSAHETYLLSESLLPFLDLKYYSHAQMLLRAAHAIPPGNDKAKQEMVDMVQYLLDRAVELNPWRAQPHLVRGMLFDYLDQRVDAIESFEQALRRDPRYLPARIELVKQLIQARRIREATERVNAGLAYSYPLNKDYLTYLRLAAHLYKDHVDPEIGEQLRRRYEAYARQLQQSQTARGAGRVLPQPLRGAAEADNP